MDESRGECTICHDSITKKTVPTHRAGVRIFHDDPKRWKTDYTEAYRRDPAFCAYCHDDEEFDL